MTPDGHDEPDSTPAADPLSALRERNRRPARPERPPLPGVKPGRPAPTTPLFSEPGDPKPEPADDNVDDHPLNDPDEITERQLAEIEEGLSGRVTRLMSKAVKYAQQNMGTPHGDTMLDDTIYAMRLSGLSHRKIAAELGDTVTEDEVVNRLAVMFAKMEAVTASEYKMLQVARLEGVINMCYAYAQDGSEGHIELLLKAIERLNRMFELESEKAKIEIEIVTDAQAVLLLSIINGVLAVICNDPRITAAVPREELSDITARALDAAEHTIIEGQGRTVELDVKPRRRSA